MTEKQVLQNTQKKVANNFNSIISLVLAGKISPIYADSQTKQTQIFQKIQMKNTSRKYLFLG